MLPKSSGSKAGFGFVKQRACQEGKDIEEGLGSEVFSLTEQKFGKWRKEIFFFFPANDLLLFHITKVILGASLIGKESACNVGDSDLIPGSGRSSEQEMGYPLQYSWASLVAHLVKYLPAMWETWV